MKRNKTIITDKAPILFKGGYLEEQNNNIQELLKKTQ